MSTKRKRYLVYPAQEAIRVVGERSPNLNLAIEIAAVVLAEGAAKVAGRFTPYEWEQLATVVGKKHFDPVVRSAGHLVADILAAYELPEDLIREVRTCPYEETWALIYACRFRLDCEPPVPANWWELKTRLSVKKDCRDHGGSPPAVGADPI